MVICSLEDCAHYLALLNAGGTEVSVTCDVEADQGRSMSGREVVREAFLKRCCLR